MATMTTGKNEGPFEVPQVTMEDILESIGGYGPFQIVLTIASVYPQLAGAMIILSPVFINGSNSSVRCDNETELNDSLDDNSTENNGYFQVSSIVQEWGLKCSNNWIVEAITSCQMAGMMTGAMLSSLLADRYGRNKAFFFVTGSMAIFGVLPAFMTNPIMYAASRFLAGFGVGGSFVVCYVHLMEFLTPSWRTICGCVSLMPAGEMLLALVAYLIPSWRLLTIATASPVLLLIAFYPFIQESPRWLFTQKRTKEAYEVIRRVAKINRKPPPQIPHIDALQSTIIEQELKVIRGFASVKLIWCDSALRRQLAILTWANVACTTVYYGVSFSAKSMTGSSYLNMLYMALLDSLVLPAVLLFNNRLGRKRTFFLYMGLATLSLLSALVLTVWIDLFQVAPMIITIATLMGRFGVGSAGGILRCIILESFPTPLRSTCLGFTVFASYFGSILAPQIGLLRKVSPALPYVAYCALTITSNILSCFLYETAGVPLTDKVIGKTRSGRYHK